MKRVVVSLAVVLAVASLLAAGCAQPAPTPTQVPAAPTKATEPTRAPAPAAPTKAAEPTRVATVQPAATPARKVDYPIKGKAISFIVGYPPGGGSDVVARMAVPYLEKELGGQIQILNRGGAATQVGLTELAMATPDGYTLGQSLMPTNLITYLDPERKAAFTRKDFVLVANQTVQPVALAVKADSPYRTLADLVQAAKARPEEIKVGDPGLMSTMHMGVLLFEQAAGMRFSSVHFDGGAPALAALLGGHVDAGVAYPLTFVPQMKAGAVRVLGMMRKGRSDLLPEVGTMIEQGYQVDFMGYYGVMAPAGTPGEIVDRLAAAVRKSTEDPEYRKQMAEMGQEIMYMGPAELSAAWDRMETDMPRLIALGRSR